MAKVVFITADYLPAVLSRAFNRLNN